MPSDFIIARRNRWAMIIPMIASIFGLPVEPLSAVGAGLYAAARAGLKFKESLDNKKE
jgi:hypothetical protein